MYLLTKIALSLAIAFALGFGTAWLAWFVGSRRREEEVTALWQRRFADLQHERDRAVTGLNRELDEARQQVPTLEKSLAERSDLIAQLESDLAEWREKLPPVQAGVAERETQIATLTAEVEARDAQIAALTRDREALAATAQPERDEQAWDELRAQVKRAEVAREQADSRADEFELAARELAEELNAALVVEKTAAREAAAEFEASIESLREEIETLRSQPTSTSTVKTLRPGVAPQGLLESLPDGRTADDLKKIRGVGPVLERTLNQLGIYFFDQVASLSADEIDWVTYHLDTFPGRIERDEWVSQARELSQGL